MPSELASKKCLPCRGGVPPLPAQEQTRLLGQLKGWELNAKGHLEKTYLYKGFRDGLEFVKRVGEMCEEQGHHGDIFLAWGKVGVEVWTHKINGLTESDFIFAAKIDSAFESFGEGQQ